MALYVVHEIESRSSAVPDSEGFLGVLVGGVFADSPEQAAALLGGAFNGKTKAGAKRDYVSSPRFLFSYYE